MQWNLRGIKYQLEMLLREETNFFVRSLRH